VSVIVCCAAIQIEVRTKSRAESHRARTGQERIADPARIEVMTEAMRAAYIDVSIGYLQYLI
jgi:hypothetical protein